MIVSRDYYYNGTGLAKLAPILFASVALLVPSNNFDIPRSVNSFDYGDYRDMNPTSSFGFQPNENEILHLQILASFATGLSKSMMELDSEMATILSNNLWDIYDRF